MNFSTVCVAWSTPLAVSSRSTTGLPAESPAVAAARTSDSDLPSGLPHAERFTVAFCTGIGWPPSGAVSCSPFRSIVTTAVAGPCFSASPARPGARVRTAFVATRPPERALPEKSPPVSSIRPSTVGVCCGASSTLAVPSSTPWAVISTPAALSSGERAARFTCVRPTVWSTVRPSAASPSARTPDSLPFAATDPADRPAMRRAAATSLVIGPVRPSEKSATTVAGSRWIGSPPSACTVPVSLASSRPVTRGVGVGSFGSVGGMPSARS